MAIYTVMYVMLLNKEAEISQMVICFDTATNLSSPICSQFCRESEVYGEAYER